LRHVLPQTRNDPIDVGYLLPAEPEHVRRTSHLLFHGSAVFLRKRGRFANNAARGRHRKVKQNLVDTHALSSRWNMNARCNINARGIVRASSFGQTGPLHRPNE
jgi:hypothetical protein